MHIGDAVSFDRYTWRVLDAREGAALLLTEDIVGQRPFHDRAGDATWADSEVRAYLNGAFLEAFAPENRARVVPVTNANPDNAWYGSRGGEDTPDTVFLLSMEECVRRYFGDSGALLDSRSPKQRYWFQRKDIHNPRRAAALLGGGWWWWTRTPGRDNRRAVYIHGDGNIGIQGNTRSSRRDGGQQRRPPPRAVDKDMMLALSLPAPL